MQFLRHSTNTQAFQPFFEGSFLEKRRIFNEPKAPKFNLEEAKNLTQITEEDSAIKAFKQELDSFYKKENIKDETGKLDPLTPEQTKKLLEMAFKKREDVIDEGINETQDKVRDLSVYLKVLQDKTGIDLDGIDSSKSYNSKLSTAIETLNTVATKLEKEYKQEAIDEDSEITAIVDASELSTYKLKAKYQSYLETRRDWFTEENSDKKSKLVTKMAGLIQEISDSLKKNYDKPSKEFLQVMEDAKEKFLKTDTENRIVKEAGFTENSEITTAIETGEKHFNTDLPNSYEKFVTNLYKELAKTDYEKNDKIPFSEAIKANKQKIEELTKNSNITALETARDTIVDKTSTEYLNAAKEVLNAESLESQKEFWSKPEHEVANELGKLYKAKTTQAKLDAVENKESSSPDAEKKADTKKTAEKSDTTKEAKQKPQLETKTYEERGKILLSNTGFLKKIGITETLSTNDIKKLDESGVKKEVVTVQKAINTYAKSQDIDIKGSNNGKIAEDGFAGNETDIAIEIIENNGKIPDSLSYLENATFTNISKKESFRFVGEKGIERISKNAQNLKEVFERNPELLGKINALTSDSKFQIDIAKDFDYPKNPADYPGISAQGIVAVWKLQGIFNLNINKIKGWEKVNKKRGPEKELTRDGLLGDNTNAALGKFSDLIKVTPVNKEKKKS